MGVNSRSLKNIPCPLLSSGWKGNACDFPELRMQLPRSAQNRCHQDQQCGCILRGIPTKVLNNDVGQAGMYLTLVQVAQLQKYTLDLGKRRVLQNAIS